jgi:hypothetical protein
MMLRVCFLACLSVCAIGCGGGGGGGFSGIPAEMVPNLRPEKASDFSIDFVNPFQGPSQKVLRLSSRISNYGAGPMEIYGQIVGANTSQTVPAFHRIKWNNGDVTTTPAGDFEYHDSHGHWHWENLVTFRLHQAVNGTDPYDAANTLVASTPKVSFCLVDTDKIPGFNGPGQPNGPRYTSCGQNTQGISVGWRDLYHASIDGQWIVVDGISDGVYWVILESDPTGLLRETDETDNRSAEKIRITGNSVAIEPP